MTGVRGGAPGCPAAEWVLAFKRRNQMLGGQPLLPDARESHDSVRRFAARPPWRVRGAYRIFGGDSEPEARFC
ncbi:hypothetical protein D187_001074 [Cystobacter fuscus DSM 2262]|uniref:Uncharacterized protein n=1 Tax=Cystobacter fuscus (strain ATCC 25194 / DSM 2262 / NBRC 100088 / M29) TaxID=1242864 RepID=S9PE03_CYSF2|nr:hypothetical protein D187_001074 [Cystobacter fuscus DSM 2262]